jgi:hypothetical protein
MMRSKIIAALYLVLALLASCTTFTAKSNKELLAELKADSYEFGYDKPGRALASRGREAMPEVLAEFEDAEDYYLCCLANILAQTPSPERDRAFIRKLQDRRNNVDDFLLDDYAEAMMLALAKNGCQAAVPIIQEYARDPRLEHDLRVQAKVSLNLLRCSEPEGEPRGKYVVSPETAPILAQPWASRALRVLEALIDHNVFANSGKVTVMSISPAKKGGSMIEGKLPDGKGTWEIDFRKGNGDRIPFRFHWYEGPKAAAQYRGLLEKRGGRWLVVRYQLLWLS